MFWRRYGIGVGLLLLSPSVAFSWEVEQGSRGNELILEVKNSSAQAIQEVCVEVSESPEWVRFQTGDVKVGEVLAPQASGKARFLFDVSEAIPSETEGSVRMLVEGREGSWAKAVALKVVPPKLVPSVTALHQNSPNPFHRSTVIRYQVAAPAQATLRVYDLAGCLVRTLVSEHKPPGSYQVEWDGRDEAGNILPDGIYFYRLITTEQGGQTEGFSGTRKMIRLR